MVTRTWWAVAGVALITAGCGSVSDQGTAPSGPASGSTTSAATVTGSATKSSGTPVTPLRWQAPVRVSAAFGVGGRPVFAAGAPGLVALVATSTEEPARTRVYTSSDAASWKAAPSLDGVRLRAVVAGGPGFVAVGTGVGASGMTVPAVAVSTDGRGWELQQPETAYGGSLSDVAVTAMGLVAVGSTADAAGAPRPAAWTSSDGATWTPGAPGQFGDVWATLARVATAGSVVVTVGEVPTESDDHPGPMRAWWSSDGRSWEPALGPPDWSSVLVGDLSSGPAGAVLVGTLFDGSTPRAWISADGSQWEGHALPTLPDTDSSFAVGVLADTERYVAVGDDVNFAEDLGPATGRPAMWTSSDGVSWYRVPHADLDGPALQAGSDAVAVLFHDTTWLVYGTTSMGVDQPPAWVLWSAAVGAR